MTDEPHKTCTHEGCDRPVLARGLCSKHYQRARAHGTTDKVDRTKECSTEDCTDRAHARGLCQRHYQQALYNDPSKPLCEVEGCDRHCYGRKTVCQRHYHQQWTKAKREAAEAAAAAELADPVSDRVPPDPPE